MGNLLGIEVIANDICPLRPEIIAADSRYWRPERKVRLALLHPPYWSMVKFSEDQRDLCNCSTVQEFLIAMSLVLQNVATSLLPQGYAVLVISDLYREGQQWPPGAMLYPYFVSHKFALRGKIIKDFGETKGSETTNAKNKNLWRYRRLKSGLWSMGLDEIWVYRRAI